MADNIHLLLLHDNHVSATLLNVCRVLSKSVLYLWTPSSSSAAAAHLSLSSKPSSTSRRLSSRPVAVERPICGLIWLRRRAVNTHFCGCQFGEGGQPCGTQQQQHTAAAASRPLFSALSGNNVIAPKAATYWFRAYVLCGSQFFARFLRRHVSTTVYTVLLPQPLPALVWDDYTCTNKHTDNGYVSCTILETRALWINFAVRF